jgi:DNA-binding MarR family transcriptional regulator
MPEELHVGVLMFIAYRSAENRIIEAVQGAGYADFTVAQARIAARIGPDGTRLSELAEQAQVAKQTATALVDRLERAGYVERVADPSDGRARLVRIAPKGAKIIPIARAEEAEIEAEWTKHLGSRRMAQLREALTLLREITDPYQRSSG